MIVFRVGDGTVPLAIVIYIDSSFVKHSIPVKPIYITLRNLDSVVSGKAMAWRVLGMLPSFKKSATPNETDEWRRQRRLGMHHACIKHVVDSINNFCEKDVHVQCADGQVKAGYPYLSRCMLFLPGISWYINWYTADSRVLCDCNLFGFR